MRDRQHFLLHLYSGSVEVAVLDGFGDVGGLDGVGTVEVGDCA